MRARAHANRSNVKQSAAYPLKCHKTKFRWRGSLLPWSDLTKLLLIKCQVCWATPNRMWKSITCHYWEQRESGQCAGHDEVWLAHGMSALECRQYVGIGKVMLRQSSLTNFVNELNEGFRSSQCLGVTTLYQVVFIECDRENCCFSSMSLFRSSPTKVLFSTPSPSFSLFFRY